MSIFYLQELCSVGWTSAVISPCAFTVICRTKCSIEEMPAGFVAIMLKLLTYVCVSPSFVRSPIMIVPPVARYVSTCCFSYACNPLWMELSDRFPVCRCCYDIKSSRQEYFFSVLTSWTGRCKLILKGDFGIEAPVCFSHTRSWIHTDRSYNQDDCN